MSETVGVPWYRDLQAVESSNVAAVGYKDGTLAIRFRSGGTYLYSPVPPEVYEALTQAESKGRFVSLHVARHPAYKCERVNNEPAVMPAEENR